MSLEEEVAIVKDILRSLNVMRLNGVACDGTIATVDGATFTVHRAVLATCSPYFKTLFTTPLTGDGGGEGPSRKSVVIPGISGELLAIIIDYAYTRVAKVDMNNVFHLVFAADQFGVEDMLADCCSFLIDNLNHQNCVFIWYFSRSYYVQELTNQAMSYMLRNFSEICRYNHDLWKLPSRILKDILSSDQLLVNDESEVWNCIVSWINKDPEQRYNLMPELLATVRFGFVHENVFTNEIKAHPLVSGNIRCLPLITKATKVKLGLSESQLHSASYSYMMRTRLPESFIFSIGGWSANGPLNLMEVYDYKVDRWAISPHVDPLGPRAYHRCVVLDKCIYVIGGTDGVSCLSSCRKFDITEKTWVHIAPMNSKRCYVSCVCINNVIYAIGGYDGNDRLSSVERYDKSRNQWTLVSPMMCKRSDAGACILNNRIFVVGGFNGDNYLSSAELYDTLRDRWSTVRDMSSMRSGVSCVAIDYCCFVMGGYDGRIRLSSCEFYNSHTKRWMIMSGMLSCRSNFTAAVLDGNIYVCGGFNGSQTTSGVERYNTKTGMWEPVCSIDVPRSALASCVVFNAYEYAPSQRCKARKYPSQEKVAGCSKSLPSFI